VREREREGLGTLRGCKPALSSRAWRSSDSLSMISVVEDESSVAVCEMLLLFSGSFFSEISIF